MNWFKEVKRAHKIANKPNQLLHLTPHGKGVAGELVRLMKRMPEVFWFIPCPTRPIHRVIQTKAAATFLPGGYTLRFNQ